MLFLVVMSREQTLFGSARSRGTLALTMNDLSWVTIVKKTVSKRVKHFLATFEKLHELYLTHSEYSVMWNLVHIGYPYSDSPLFHVLYELKISLCKILQIQRGDFQDGGRT